jgi:hypothetical protein
MISDPAMVRATARRCGAVAISERSLSSSSLPRRRTSIGGSITGFVAAREAGGRRNVNGETMGQHDDRTHP